MLSVGNDVISVTKDCINQMMENEAELISIYYGEDFSKEDADIVAQWVADTWPDCDVEVNAGGQPIYYCIISVE